MPTLQAIQVAQLVRDVGITGQAAVIAVAIAKGESRFDTDAVGDVGIQTSKWGPSIGLWQIRSLKAERGTGGTRDANRLPDPAFNARSMRAISSGGTNWQPWSVFTSGAYRTFLAEAQAAVSSLGGTGTVPSGAEVPAQAPPTPAITPPPTASLVAGLAVYGPSQLRLEGQELTGLCDVLTADLDRSVDDAATLTISVSDPHLKLLRSGLLEERTRTDLDGILFELIGVAKSRRDMQLTMIDAAAAEYIHDIPTEPITQAPGSGSRGDFIRRLAARHAWVQVDIETGADPLVELATEPDESVWESIGRAAGDVGWRRLAVANRLLVGSEEWLASRTAPTVIREGEGGVDRIEFDFLVGEESSRATVTCDAALWSAPPSQAVIVEGQGPADGGWLVVGVRKRVAATEAVIELGRVQPPLPEPVPPPPPAEYAAPAQAPSGGPVVPGATSSQGWQWPMAGRVSSGFGPRESPGGIGSTDHAGLDIAGPTGTPIYAARGGTVTVAGSAGGYGFAVYLNHGGGLFSRYGHMSEVGCTRGQTVAKGQQIGLCGSTGNSTGPHCHFEIRPGDRPVNPLPLLPPR